MIIIGIIKEICSGFVWDGVYVISYFTKYWLSVLKNDPSQCFNVGSTLFQRCGSKWNKNETKSNVGFSTLHNVDTTSVPDA